MKPTKGLSKDLRPEEQPEGTYFFGKNGLQSDRKGAVTNEPGFELIRKFVPRNYAINGILETDTHKCITFSTNDINSSVQLINLKTRVVEFDFNDINTDYLLGFKSSNYITGEVQRNYKGDIICTFTDKNEPPKYLNFGEPETSTLISWYLFPRFDEPEITKYISPGGFLDVGSYYISVRYWKLDGTKTAFSTVTSGIVISSNDGSEVADDGIGITINAMDLAYAYIEVAIISKVKGVTSARTLDKLPVVPGSSTIVFSGENITYDIALEEILAPQVNYDRIGTMTQLNDSLFIGDLHNDLDMLDMQPYANMINLMWHSKLLNFNDENEKHKSGIEKSFKHREVYAFYVRYRAKGRFSPWYTIAGPSMPAAMNAVSVIAQNSGLAGRVFEYEDSVDTFSISGKYGLTGSYANDTEKYPYTDDFDSSGIGGRDLRGQPVLHHKMPSVKLCKEALYATETEYGTTKLDLLGIEALNVILPTKYKNTIDGYEIGYAKRTIENMTVYSQDILLYGAKDHNASSPTSGSSVISTGHNWDSNLIETEQDTLRYHGLDILLNRPGIKPNHTTANLKLNVKVKKIYESWSYPANGSKADAYGHTVWLSDVFANGTADFVDPTLTSYVNALYDPRYMQVNSLYGQFNNKYRETALVGYLGPPYLPINNVGQSNLAVVSTYLIDLCDVKSDVYQSFYTQDIISAGDVIDIDKTNKLWGGDIFISLYTFHTYGAIDEDWEVVYDKKNKYATPDKRMHIVVHRHIVESVANHYTRYEVVGNEYSKWYTHNSLISGSPYLTDVYPLAYSGKIDPNQIKLVRGGEAINDFRVPHIFSPYRDYITDFPYRVHRGGKLDRQNNQRSWRSFLALDYYENQKDKGFIVNLESMDDKLLIHMENALLVTRDKAKLESGLLGITIGTGDIFELEPQEAQASKLGFAGTQHDLACVKTPIGYIFPDAKQGELFLYGQGKLSKLNTGLDNFYREFLPVIGNNPFIGNGITVGWDHMHKRVLLTVKNQIPTGVDTEAVKVIKDLETEIYQIALNEVVFLNGKYVKYLGVNDFGVTGYECINKASENCPAPLNLVFTVTDPAGLAASWDPPIGSTPHYEYELWNVDTNTMIDIGLTNGTTYTNAVFTINTMYMFKVAAHCHAEDTTISNFLIAYDALVDYTVEPPPPPLPNQKCTILVSGANVPLNPTSGNYSATLQITMDSNPTVIGVMSSTIIQPTTMMVTMNPTLISNFPATVNVVVRVTNLFPAVSPTSDGLPSFPVWPGTAISPSIVTASLDAYREATYTAVPLTGPFIGYLILTYP
jgi:hypothetical protein